MGNWGSTRDEVRVSIRNIDIHFKKEEDVIALVIYKQGNPDPFSIVKIPLEGEDDIQSK